MKVIAYNGSPRKNGNTYDSLKYICDELEKNNIETEIIHVGNKKISGCVACSTCFKNKDEKCVHDDIVNVEIQRIKEADGIIIGSPVHYAAIGGAMKCFLDRLFYVAGANGGLMRHKVGAAVAVARRSGGSATFEQLNNFLLISEMFIPSGYYWNIVHGAAEGETIQDLEGVQNMQVLGQNMAYMIKAFEYSKDVILKPEKIVDKKRTNFIRDLS